MNTPEADTDVIANPAGAEVDLADDSKESGPSENAAPTIGRRPRKPLNRDLFAKVAAAAKAHVEGGNNEDDDVIAGTEEVAAKPATASTAAAPEAPARQGPPPEAIAAWERTNLRAKELDDRESKLKEREQRSRDVAGKFDADPFVAMKDLVRTSLGDEASEEEVNEELAFQITLMSLSLSGATIDKNNQAYDLKKVKRELRQRRAQERKAIADGEARRAEESKTAREKSVIEQIGREFEPLAPKFGWLASSEAPAGLLFDVIKRHHESTGEILELAQAAKLADDYLASADKAWYEKRKHLLTPMPTPTSTPATAPQGDPPRRSRALSNVDASEDSAVPDRPGPQLSREERRKRTWEKHRDALRASNRD